MIDGTTKRPVLAICGAGNAGHAIAVVASQTFDGEIVWLTSTDEKAETIRRGVFSRDGLRGTGVITGIANRVRLISADPAEAIPQADLVIIAVPGFAHAAILQRIAPHLKADAMVGALPARSGFEFEATQLIPGIEPRGNRAIFGLQTLPWSARVQELGRVVHFGALKANVLMATLPSRHAPAAAAHLTRLLGTQILPTTSFLNISLGNPGLIVHPGIMYGLFSDWNGRCFAETEVPFFYKDVTDAAGARIEEMSADVVATAKAVELRSRGSFDLSGVLHVRRWLQISYPTQTQDLSTAARAFRTGPLQHRKAPMSEAAPGEFVPNFQYRYLSEDVPFGVVFAKAVADLAAVRTPALDMLLGWCQDRLGKKYLVEGRLGGQDVAGLPIPQNHGISTVSDLVEWYARLAPRNKPAVLARRRALPHNMSLGG